LGAGAGAGAGGEEEAVVVKEVKEVLAEMSGGRFKSKKLSEHSAAFNSLEKIKRNMMQVVVWSVVLSAAGGGGCGFVVVDDVVFVAISLHHPI
jgi:hypothetical protein